MSVIAVLGTYDSKGEELRFVAEQIATSGNEPLLIDVGTGGPAAGGVDFDRDTVAAEAGIDLTQLLEAHDRGACVTAMTRAAPVLLSRLAAEGKIHGVISLGGGGGTAIGTAAMRALPIGFPKVMVSTLASGNTAPYIGDKDIVMFPSIVDVAGLNRVTRVIFTRAAGAIRGMTAATPAAAEEKPVIAASMFGNTTDGVNLAKEIFDEAGFETLIFHATGTGGRTMESLVSSGLVSGVFDFTTTEWADEFVGGILGAGPERLDAAAKAGVPAVIVPGCLDMVNFGERASVPEKFADRLFYIHNPQVTLMRVNAGESAEIGRILAEKANASKGPVAVLLPRRGLSVIGAPGQPFHDLAADQALFDAIRSHIRPGVELIERDLVVNDPAFASLAARTLLRLMQSVSQS